MTPQEVKVWVHLRSWRRSGFHFRRQAPWENLILDFVCLKHYLVVEIDGGGHGHHHQSVRDANRDDRLRFAGFRVLRFWNDEVDRNLDGVLDTIYTALDPTAGLRPYPPRTGEGSPVAAASSATSDVLA